MQAVPGTKGYEKAVQRFVESSQALSFHRVCKDFLPYLPPQPGSILDVGAGAGQNAAALARMGYSVVALEPMPDFLMAAQIAYLGLPIAWLNDSLPRLQSLGPEAAQFDFILVEGVWHHLNEGERSLAITRFAQLLKRGGKWGLSLRNGPPGMGTCVYPTNADRTCQQAQQQGLECVFRLDAQPSIYSHKPDVRWARLVLQKPY